MSELDKFKRRVIRSVARLMLHEKKTDDELWAQMKKETGCDCKQLWSRMRGLTIRKLKRQLASDDRVDTIASLARMSLTDWLLFDLVLVHEKIDFIGKESMMNSNNDRRVLVNLFELVRMFEIEGLRGDALADAWTGATVHYNSLGYQCSPMLLQRRWYQLKELTRERFYAFWYKYRGNVKKISEDGTQALTPTPLLAELAKQYPHVITDPFPEWEKLIAQRLVIMPQEFENKMREHMPPRPVNDAEPEIILVEPVVETIDLSETEQVPKKSDTQLDPSVKVKSEPVDIDVNDEFEAQNVAVEHSVQDATVDNAEIKDSVQIKSALAATEAEEQAVSDSNVFEDNSITVDYPNAETGELEQNIENNVDSNETVMPQISRVFGNVFIDEETLSRLDPVPEQSPENNVNQNSEVNEHDTIVLDSSSDIVGMSLDTSVHNQEDAVSIPLSDEELATTQDKRLVDDASANNIRNEALPTVKSENIMPYIQSASSLKIETELEETDKEESLTEINDINSAISQDDKKPENFDTSIADLENIEDDIIKIKTAADNGMEMQDLETFGIIPTDLDFADDGIEFIEEETSSDDIMAEINNESEQTQGEEDVPKFDLKLLMNPVVIVKKLDDVSILKGIELDNSFHAGSKILIDCIETECKAVPSVIDNTKIIPSVNDESMPDETECNIVRSVIDNKIIIPPANDDTIAMCVQEIKKEILVSQSDESDDEIPESQRVKLSSHLLQKPRSRSYNPIQLCKNPDFNTRLKRLSIGFFGSMRNRQLLKSCKPMTIDLHKSFEPKLIDGTLYLKRNDTDAIVTNKEDGESEQSASVLPSAMSVQSLIDCSVGTFLYPAKPDDNIITERKKVINLPDITEVRRNNSKLLTAEVTPIRVQNEIASAPEQPMTTESPLVIPETNVIVSDAKPIDVQVKSENDNVTATDKEAFVVEGEVESSTAIKMRNTIQEINATENEILKTATPSQPDVAGIPTVSKEKEAITPVEAKTKKCQARRPYMSLPWISKVRPLPTADDTLLTMDSLVKMLNVLSNGEDTPAFKPKKLRKLRHKVKSGKLTSESCDLKEVEHSKDSELIKSSASDDCKQTDEPTKSEKQKKLKIRVSHAVNGQRHKNGNYCCWASDKYFRQNIKNSSTEKHPCPPNECTCCCMKALQNTIRTHNSGDGRILKACETIESVVRQTQNFNMLPLESQITTIIEDEEQPDENVADSTIPSNDCDTTQVNNDVAQEVDVQEVVKETTPPRDQIHIDAVRGEIRVTSGNTTNVMDVQGEITVRTTADQLEYPNLIPDEMLIKPRKRNSQVIQQDPKESLFRYIKAAPNRRLGSKNLTTSGTVDTSESHIVIDGSKSAPELSIRKYQTPKPRVKHKLVRLKDQTKQGTKEYDRPISLGKNMILLTTVQIPRKITFVTSEQSSGMIPKLPAGVKLILQPNGELVVSVDPGTKLTDDEIASLPKLMAAVQQQLKINSLDPTQRSVEPADVVTISDDESKTSNENPSVIVDDNINDIGQTTDSGTLQTEIGREQGAQVNIDDQSQVTNEQIEQTNIHEQLVNAHAEEPLNAEIIPLEISNPVPEISVGNVQEKTEDSSQHSGDMCVQENTINNETINSQNSGNTISQTTIEQPQITTVEDRSGSDATKDGTEGTVGSTIKKTILSDLMEMSGISTEDTMITSQENPPESIPEPMPTMILSDGGMKVQELNPINYFSELKYASEMGGKFFKLNMVTRVLIPINVSIKKQFPVPSLIPLKIAPKPVIDLTEDDDISVEPKNPSKFGHLTQVLAHNICNSLIQKHNTSITPLKLFKSVHSNLLRRSKFIGKQNKRDASVLARSKTPKKRGRKRKQDFNDQIEVQIDLLDSDEPMEEEYLFDSYGEGASLPTDSSDDEPLLNKVRRRNPVAPPITSGSRSLLKHMHIADEALAGTSNVPTDEAPEIEMPIDEHIDMDIEYLSDDNENADENCILGV